jgi:hypothetical protein
MRSQESFYPESPSGKQQKQTCVTHSLYHQIKIDVIGKKSDNMDDIRHGVGEFSERVIELR